MREREREWDRERDRGIHNRQTAPETEGELRGERRKKQTNKEKIIKADTAKYLRLSQRHTFPTACTETYYFVHNKNVSNNNKTRKKSGTLDHVSL